MSILESDVYMKENKLSAGWLNRKIETKISI